MDKSAPFHVYVNSAQVSFSTHDFVIELGIKGSNSHPGTLSSEELQGTVYMSPQHMKAFAGMLLDHLHQYEAVFGPINLKPNDSALRAIAEAAPTTER